MYGIHKYRNTQNIACLFNILLEGHHNFLKIEMSFSNIGDFKKIWNCTKTIFLCALCIAPPPPFPRDLSVALVGADFFFSPELRQDAPLKKVEESVTERGNSMWADISPMETNHSLHLDVICRGR